MNNFNSMMGNANGIYPKTTSPSYFNSTYSTPIEPTAAKEL